MQMKISKEILYRINEIIILRDEIRELSTGDYETYINIDLGKQLEKLSKLVASMAITVNGIEKLKLSKKELKDEHTSKGQS